MGAINRSCGRGSSPGACEIRVKCNHHVLILHDLLQRHLHVLTNGCHDCLPGLGDVTSWSVQPAPIGVRQKPRQS